MNSLCQSARNRDGIRRQAKLAAGRLVFCLGLVCGLLLGAWDSQAQPSVTTNAAGTLVLANHFGDLNDDGRVNVLDVVLLTHHLNGTRLLPTNLLARADLNQDGQIKPTDRRILADMIAARLVKADEDFDGDELSNAEELRRGTSPFDPDTDHDGGLDGWEVAEGTNPLDAQSRMVITIVASPGVQVVHPLIQNTDTNALGPVVARPPIQVIFPAMPEGEEVGAITVARPPVQVIFPAMAEAEEIGAITVARPPVQVIHPLLQNEDTNSAPVLARPPVQVIHPLIQDTDTNAPGPVLARPPVKVINPAP